MTRGTTAVIPAEVFAIAADELSVTGAVVSHP